MRKVLVSEQVTVFMRKQAPEPRRALREALDRLKEGKGDVLALEENLRGYWRLRVGRYRVVFDYEDGGTIRCIFVEDRRLVYEVFAAMMKERL